MSKELHDIYDDHVRGERPLYREYLKEKERVEDIKTVLIGIALIVLFGVGLVLLKSMGCEYPCMI